jgi:hypothetical protein
LIPLESGPTEIVSRCTDACPRVRTSVNALPMLCTGWSSHNRVGNEVNQGKSQDSPYKLMGGDDSRDAISLRAIGTY